MIRNMGISRYHMYSACLTHSTPDNGLVFFISLSMSMSLSYFAEKGKYEANR